VKLAFCVERVLTVLLLSSHFGHDKSLEIKPYAALPDGERPILLYAGDGVSDLSAAAETNLLFAKEGKGNHRTTVLFNWRLKTDNYLDLVTFCQRRGMPYTTFRDWSTILSTSQDILAGKKSPSEVAVQVKSA
jgi:2-hydroxy-3-keto-5-methylthiopentenyl-1-phosphate phosphatase